MENQFKMAYKWEYSGIHFIWERISLTSLTAPWPMTAVSRSIPSTFLPPAMSLTAATRYLGPHGPHGFTP